MVKFNIVNVVATASLSERVNLEDLGRMKGVTYDEEICGGRVAYLRLPEMKGTVSVFFSGKMISMRTKSEDDAFRDLQSARDFLVEKKLVRPVDLAPRVQNIVVTADLGKIVDLEELARHYGLVYEPEQFPGAILIITEPHKASILVFASGKIVIAGLKRSSQIGSVFRYVLRIMDKRGDRLCAIR